jgi:predicted transposase YbfD/YdcC
MEENHGRAVLKELLGELDLQGLLIQADALHTQKPLFKSSRSRGPTSPDRQGQPEAPASTDQRQIEGIHPIRFLATDHEVGHGRDIPWTLRAKEASDPIRQEWVGTSWIIEGLTPGIRDGMPFNASHLFLTSIRTTPEALLRLVKHRWSLEGWHWIRDTQLHEDDRRHRCHGAA